MNKQSFINRFRSLALLMGLALTLLGFYQPAQAAPAEAPTQQPAHSCNQSNIGEYSNDGTHWWKCTSFGWIKPGSYDCGFVANGTQATNHRYGAKYVCNNGVWELTQLGPNAAMTLHWDGSRLVLTWYGHCARSAGTENPKIFNVNADGSVGERIGAGQSNAFGPNGVCAGDQVTTQWFSHDTKMVSGTTVQVWAGPASSRLVRNFIIP